MQLPSYPTNTTIIQLASPTNHWCSLAGLSRVEELEARCSELEELYKEAVQARDEAIEERNSATVVLAIQLEKETQELNSKIDTLNKENNRLLDENDDLQIKLEYARKDLKKLQKTHIKLQLETEKYITEKDDAIQKLKEFENAESKNKSESKEQNTNNHNCRTNSCNKESNIASDIRSANGSQTDIKAATAIATIGNNNSDSSGESSVDNSVNSSNTNHVKTNGLHKESDGKVPETKAVASAKDMDKDEGHTSISKDEQEPRPPIKLKTSSIQDDYDVHEELGKGKFGVVKRVTHKSSGEVLAAKYIKTSSVAGSSRDDVLREINIMGRLHHERLVGLLDAYDAGRNIIMIMEFISGGELFERVVDEDCLTEKEAAHYMYQILQGLQHMHDMSILHLDLKPENIVCVSKDSWDIKLIDFGLAMELVPGTKLKAMKGTPEFMAPEAVNFETIGKASDMWSIGVIAYILLSGLSPFMGDDNNETLSNVNAAEWDFDDEAFDVISEEAKEFISQLLIKNPKKRNTVEDCLNHNWMKKSASSDAVKIDTKKLKQFLAKRRWQKSVNALVAVRRLSSMTNLLGLNKSRPSISPLLAVVPSTKEESEEDEEKESKNENEKDEKMNENDDSKESETETANINEAKQGNEKNNNVAVKDNQENSQQNLGEQHLTQQHQPQPEQPQPEQTEPTRVEQPQTEQTQTEPTQAESLQSEQSGPTQAEELQLEEQGENRINENEEMQILSKKPVFIKELDDFTVREGETVIMEAIVDGGPGCRVEWLFDGGEVNDREGVSIVDHGDGRHTVVITECEEEDAGEYICLIVNENGKARSRGFLIVEDEPESGPDIDPPTFTKELTDMAAQEGDTVTMEVTVAGEDYDLEWFKNAVDVVEGGRFSFINKGEGQHALVITSVEDDDTGEYCCVAQNDGGRGTCAGYFTVEVEEEEEEEEDISEDETDEEMYEEEKVKLKNGFIEDFYAVEEEIGRGRFGIVRKCVHIQTGIHFVAKAIKTRPSQKEEFRREIDVLNSLRHPNICRIRDAFEGAREIVLVLEFNRGGDLLKRINDEPMSEPESVNILQQVLNAVNYIHDNSYMHLDIKPENIMFKREGGNTVKLIDFSLTRKYDPKVETKISQGTAEYVAPEIVNYDCVTPATDMWAVGVISYMLLSGKSPFLGESEADTFANITHCRWLFTDVFNDVSGEAKEYISKLLVKQKTGRMSASECLKHPWITTVGARGEKERSIRPTLSHTTSLSDLSTRLLDGGDIPESISSVESYLRLHSSSDDVFTEEDGRQSVDAKELEATLQVFMLKLRDVESERAELEEMLQKEENKAKELERNKNNLREKITKLKKENETLSAQVKSKNDLLIKVGNLETETKHLNEKLEEKNKFQKTLEERCSNLRTKLEQYDFLEEKLYRYEREKKETVRTIENLQEELDELKHVEKNLENKNAENDKEKSTKIEELMSEKQSIENKYNELRLEKDNIVSELTKKSSIIENKRKELSNQVRSLEKKTKDLEKDLQKRENELSEAKGKLVQSKELLNQTANLEKKIKDLDVVLKERENDLSETKKKLERSEKDYEKLKRRTSKEIEAKVASISEENQKTNQELEDKMTSKIASMIEEKQGIEKECTKFKKQKEEAQKTCEELASKLSKAYSEMEKLKSSSILARDYDKLRRERDELKKNITSLEEKCSKLSRDLKSRDTQISDLQNDLESSEKEKQKIQEMRKISKINSENNSESLKSTLIDLESTILAHKSTIAVSKGEIELLQEKLALEEDKNARFREELQDKKRAISDLKSEKAEIIAQYEDELDEALDCYEQSKKEMITKFEKRLKELENESSSENNRNTGERQIVNEEEVKAVIRATFESLGQLRSLGETKDKFDKGLLKTVKMQTDFIVKGLNNNHQIDDQTSVFEELEAAIGKRATARKELEEKLEDSLKEKDLVVARVNKVKQKYHDQSDALLDAKHKIEVLQNTIQESREKVLKVDNLEEENKVLKWRMNELSSMKQTLDEKIDDQEGEMLLLEREFQQCKEKLQTMEQLEDENTSLQNTVEKLEKSIDNQNNKMTEAVKKLEEENASLKHKVKMFYKTNGDLREKLSDSEKEIGILESKFDFNKRALKNSESENERLQRANQTVKEKLKSAKANVKTLEHQLEEKKDSYETLFKENCDLQKSFDTIDSQNGDFKKQIEDNLQDIKALRKQEEMLLEATETLEKEKEELNVKWNSLLKEKQNKDDELGRLKKEVENLRTQLTNQKDVLERRQDEIEILKSDLKERKKLEAQIKELKKQEEEGYKVLENLRTKNKRLEFELCDLRKNQQQKEDDCFKSQSEKESLQSEVHEMSSSLRELQQEKKNLTLKINEQEKVLQEKSDAFAKLQTQLNTLNKNLTDSNNSIQDLENENDRLKTNLEKLNQTIREQKQNIIAKEQQFQSIKEQDEVNNKRLSSLMKDNKDLISESIANNKLIEEQRVHLSEATDEVEKLQRTIEDFEKEKKSGFAMYQELKRQCEEKESKLKSSNDIKNELALFEEKLDAMKIEMSTVKGDLKRKSDDFDILNEENICLNKDVENLRKERLEGYQMLGQMEKKNVQLKEELRQVRKALRVYKDEVTKQNEKIKRKDEEIQTSAIKIRKLSNEKMPLDDEKLDDSFQELEDPFDQTLEKTELFKIDEVQMLEAEQPMQNSLFETLAENKPIVVDNSVQTEAQSIERPVLVNNEVQTESPLHVNSGVQTAQKTVERLFLVESGVQTEAQSTERPALSKSTQTERPVYINSCMQTAIKTIDRSVLVRPVLADNETQTARTLHVNNAVQTAQKTLGDRSILIDNDVQTEERTITRPILVDGEVQTENLPPDEPILVEDAADNSDQTDKHDFQKFAFVENGMQTEEHVFYRPHHNDSGTQTVFPKLIVDNSAQTEDEVNDSRPAYVYNGVQTDQKDSEEHLQVEKVGKAEQQLCEKPVSVDEEVQTEEQSNNPSFKNVAQIGIESNQNTTDLNFEENFKRQLSMMTTRNEELEGELTYEKNRSEYLEKRRRELQEHLVKLQEKEKADDLNEKIAKLKDNNKILSEEIEAQKRKIEELHSKLDQDSKNQVELLESRLQAIKHRFITCVLEPLTNMRQHDQDVCIEKFATWEKIKEDIMEMLRKHDEIKSENQSLRLAWMKLNKDYRQMTTEGEKDTEAQTTICNSNSRGVDTSSTELVIQKLKTLKEKFQEMRVDTNFFEEFQELRLEQDDLKKKIKEDSEQVNLLKEQSQEIISRVGNMIDIFEGKPTHTESRLELNFNFEATLRSSFTEHYGRTDNQGTFLMDEAEEVSFSDELQHIDPQYFPGIFQEMLAKLGSEFEIEQRDVMVELVRRNRQVYELQKEIDCLNAKLKAKLLESKHEKIKEEDYKDIEKMKKENNQLNEQNEKLNQLIQEVNSQKESKETELSLLTKEKQELEKELENMKQTHQTTLQELKMVKESMKKISKQKEDMSVGIVLRDKKISLYEKELKDLQNRKNVKNGEGTVQNGHEDDEGVINDLRDELREAQHRAAALEVELDQLQESIKSDQEEVENKWAQRLRKECSELQADLGDKFAQEKRVWLKKEAELQNMIRQMKTLLEKRAKEAQVMKKKLEKQEIERSPENDLGGASRPGREQPDEQTKKVFNELSNSSPNQKLIGNPEISRSASKSSDLTSVASLDSSSISDDAVDGRSLDAVDTAGQLGKVNKKKDGLSDRDLRRVAYKLTNEEWTQLGSFLGVSDTELQSILALNMGPQEKAFRLLCLWNSRSTLGRNQLVSQLAIALEEINRKDAAQFVVEQMMTGKPRKKFFGWRK